VTDEQSRTLGQIEAKVDAILERIGEQDKKYWDHEKRVRDLEKTKWRQQGLTALVAGVISSAVAYFVRSNIT